MTLRNPDDPSLLRGLSVEIDDDPEEGWGKKDRYVEMRVFHKGDYVAVFTFRLARKYAYAVDIEVWPKYRRRGVASWVYREVERRFNVIVKHSKDQTEAGKAFARGRRHNPSIRWSREDGASGLVPDQTNIDYLGFTVWMTPEEFIALNPPVGKRSTGSLAHLRSSGSWAPFWVSAEWDDDAEQWNVMSHEGRHRASLAQEWGVTAVPVDVFPRSGMRARHVSGVMRKSPFRSDPRAPLALVLPTARKGKIHGSS